MMALVVEGSFSQASVESRVMGCHVLDPPRHLGSVRFFHCAHERGTDEAFDRAPGYAGTPPRPPPSL